MMKPNSILEEVWRVKDALAREAGYNIDRVFDELKQLTAQEEKAGRRIIRSAAELRGYAASAEAIALKETPPRPDSSK